MFDLVRALDGKLPNFAGVKYTHEDFMDYQSCMSYETENSICFGDVMKTCYRH